MMKKKGNMRTIRIKQETEIPGTDFILEAGDKIVVSNKESGSLYEGIHRELNRYFTEFPDPWEAGLEISSDVMSAAKRAGVDLEQVAWGMWQTTQDYLH